MNRPRSACLLAALVTLAPGCVPLSGTMPAQTWRADQPDAQCKASALSDPLSDAWTKTSRAALEAALDGDSPVVVSALGCRSEVLAGCRATGAYEVASVTPQPGERGTIRERWELDRAGVSAEELSGACDGATHVVAAASVGSLPGGGAEDTAPLWLDLAPLGLGDFDLTGEWRGVMRQPGGPYETYDLHMELEQHGARVRGTTQLGTVDGEYWGVLRFEGRLEGNTLYYADAEVIEDNLGIFLEWCTKGGYTLVDPRARRMKGPWRAPLCAPGSVEVERVAPAAPRPKPAVRAAPAG